jgi:hypothetical protein
MAPAVKPGVAAAMLAAHIAALPAPTTTTSYSGRPRFLSVVVRLSSPARIPRARRRILRRTSFRQIDSGYSARQMRVNEAQARNLL